MWTCIQPIRHPSIGSREERSKKKWIETFTLDSTSNALVATLNTIFLYKNVKVEVLFL